MPVARFISTGSLSVPTANLKASITDRLSCKAHTIRGPNRPVVRPEFIATDWRHLTATAARNRANDLRSSPTTLGRLHAAEWRRRRWRALERGDLALPAQRFCREDAPHTAL